MESAVCDIGLYHFNEPRRILVPLNTERIDFERINEGNKTLYKVTIVAPNDCSVTFNAGVSKLRYLQSIRFDNNKNGDAYKPLREKFLEKVSANQIVTEYSSDNFHSSNLQGENLPVLIHLEPLTLRSSVLENASNFLQLYPRLKYLDLEGCPKLITNDKANLEALCKKKRIQLVL